MEGLKQALVQLRGSDHEGALRSLLDAWRSSREARHPRVADLVDRVSAIVTEARGPIRGRTVKARTEVWTATATARDVADVGRLLATPWPGTWKNAMPVLEALVAFPSDPRIAMALAELLARTPYDTWTSGAFYRPLLDCVRETADVRTLSILRADLEREKSRYWREGTRPIVEAVVSAIERAYPAGAPSLRAEDAAVLDQLEALFAGERTLEQTTARTEEDLLAAIYAAPDDDAPRAVFADWLTERGDPRGELISLQLRRHAGPSTEAMQKREAQLLRRHQKRWTAELETGLAKDGRVFERGFLARAILDAEGEGPIPPKVFSDPAWATVWSVGLAFSIEWRRLGAPILALPAMQWLRDVGGLTREALSSLARGEPRPRLASIEVAIEPPREPDDAFEASLTEIAETRSLPGLRRLAVRGEPEPALALLRGRLAQQLERFTIVGHRLPLAPLARLVEELTRAHPLPLPEIAVLEPDHRVRPQWLFVGRRDAEGRFTRVEALDGSPMHVLPYHYQLRELLKALGPDDLTELRIDPSLEGTYARDEITEIERELARFTRLETVVVPWARSAREAATGIPVKLVVSGALDWRERIGELIRAAARAPLQLSFDAYDVNGGGEVPIGADADAVAVAEELATKKRIKSLHLYRRAAAETCALEVRNMDVTLRASPRTVEDLLDWLVGWLRERPDIGSGGIDFAFPRYVEGGQNFHRRRAPLAATPRFLTVLGPGHRERLPFDELAKIELPFLRKVRTDVHFLLVLGRHPADIPSEEDFLALERALCGAMWQSYRASWGVAPPELARRRLGPILEARGLPLAIDGSGARLRWAAPEPDGAALEIEWIDPLTALRFAVRAGVGRDLDTLLGPDGYYRAMTLADATASFEHLAAQLERDFSSIFRTSSGTT